MSWHPLGPDPAAQKYDLTNDEMMMVLSGRTTPEKLINQREKAERDATNAEELRWILHNIPAYLKHLQTRELIALLRADYLGSGVFYAHPVKDFKYNGYITISNIWGIELQSFRDMLKEELATRPHLKSGKANRRLLATKNRGQSKSKNR